MKFALNWLSTNFMLLENEFSLRLHVFVRFFRANLMSQTVSSQRILLCFAVHHYPWLDGGHITHFRLLSVFL